MPAYDPNNIFAKILRGEIPSIKVYEDQDTVAIMDIMPQVDGHVLVIPRANRNHAAAIKWASFLSSNVEAQVGLWQNGYGLPTSLTAQRDPRMREPQPFLGQSMFEASVEGREVFYTHLVRDWPRVQIEMGRQLDAMFQGNKTPDQAWNDFEAAMVRQYG